MIQQLKCSDCEKTVEIDLPCVLVRKIICSNCLESKLQDHESQANSIRKVLKREGDNNETMHSGEQHS